MRAFATVVLLASVGVIAYAAVTYQSSQSRLDATSFTATVVAQEVPVPVATTLETAQASGVPPAPAAAAPAARATTVTGVDETALRYFARQGDTQRVQTEIQRLRSLYPGWEPPANLLADDYVPDADIIRIWELFGEGDFAGARAAIAAKQQADSTFVPSDDLLASLALGEAGLRLRNASDARQYETVISIAANEPGLLTCEAIDNLWRLAEAFARTGNTPRATDAYTYALTNCTNPSERFATVQKAIDELPRGDIDPLLALERTVDGQPEFAALRLDLARSSVAASLEDGGAAATPADVELLRNAAQAAGDAEDMRLVGWHELAEGRANEARRWFERAATADPSAESAQGLGVALLELRDPQAAEAALADYRDSTEELTALYLDAAAALLSLEPRVDLESATLGRIVAAATAARDANVAQELGWYAYTFQQPQTASEWFTLALRWQVDLEPAAYGLMVASNALGNRATVETIRTQWGARSSRIANFGRAGAAPSPGVPTAPPPMPRPRPMATGPGAPYIQPAAIVQAQVSRPPAATQPRAAPAPRGCSGTVPAASLSAGAALTYAWCLMELNRPAQAVDHFSRALQSQSEATRSDAAYGLSLAYIRLGLASEAAVAAAAAPLTDRRAIELEVSILTERAINAYDLGDYARALDAMDARARYAPERNDLLTLRAWSYFHLKRYGEARRIFAAVAATGYGDAAAGLAATEGVLRSQGAPDNNF